ncbi:MAG: dockerin type I domain-containing protein [Lentimicrobiaceae bacterium]|nr:dockerin type I domain-containing protein [Lentimicrobiaceae bacterium]
MKNFGYNIRNYFLPVAKAIAIFCLNLSVLYPASAQSVINSGSTLYITSGTSWINTSSLIIQNGASLINHGTLHLKGDLDNQNIIASNLGNGTLNLTGTTVQKIKGINITGNLTVNNPAGLELYGNTTISSTLTLTNGIVSLNTSNLLLDTTATIEGTPSASAMVVATGTGELRKMFKDTGSFIFPIGDTTGVAEYTPATLNFTSGNFAGGKYVGVRLKNAPLSGLTDSYLNRYWQVSTNANNFICDALFNYAAPADVSGTENTIYCGLFNVPSSATYAIANTSLHQLSATGLTSLGTFTGESTEKILNLTSLFTEGLYAGSSTMRKAQDESGDKYTGTTADQVSIELHSALAGDYANILYTNPTVSLAINGTATAIFPAVKRASYYVTIKHHNSIETTTAQPISFAGRTLNYTYDSPAKVYGNNLKEVLGVYVTYGGDVNQDGFVDSGDMTPVDNDAANFAMGYLATDANGDGFVDSADMTIIDNNAANFVSAIIP